MNCDKKSYQTIIVGLDMTPRYVGNYTMDQIYDFVKYAKGVNPATTATISEFGNIAVVVHKLFVENRIFCSGIEGSDAKENIDE